MFWLLTCPDKVLYLQYWGFWFWLLFHLCLFGSLFFVLFSCLFTWLQCTLNWKNKIAYSLRSFWFSISSFTEEVLRFSAWWISLFKVCPTCLPPFLLTHKCGLAFCLLFRLGAEGPVSAYTLYLNMLSLNSKRIKKLTASLKKKFLCLVLYCSGALQQYSAFYKLESDEL